MDKYAGVGRPLRLIESAVVLADPGWLPADSGWDGLDDLAAEHRRLLAQRRAAAIERSELLERFEAEDEAHAQALRDSMRHGGDASAEFPTVTSPPERREAAQRAEQTLTAANEVLDEFLASAIAEIEGAADGWIGALSTQKEQARNKRDEAARLLVEAETEEMDLRRLSVWVLRNSGRDPRASFRILDTRFLKWEGLSEVFLPQEKKLLPNPDRLEPEGGADTRAGHQEEYDRSLAQA